MFFWFHFPFYSLHNLFFYNSMKLEKLWSSRKVKGKTRKKMGNTKEIFCHIINFSYTPAPKKEVRQLLLIWCTHNFFHWYSQSLSESRNMTKCVASHVCFFLTTWELALNSRLCAFSSSFFYFSHLMSVEIHSREIDISHESQSLHLCLFVYEFFFCAGWNW